MVEEEVFMHLRSELRRDLDWLIRLNHFFPSRDSPEVNFLVLKLKSRICSSLVGRSMTFLDVVTEDFFLLVRTSCTSFDE